MRSKFFFRVFDFLTLAAVFIMSVHLAKAHAGFSPAPLFPGIREFPILVLLGIAWHWTTRASGLYGEYTNLTCEMSVLATLVFLQLLGAAVMLFFMKSLTLNRFFVLLYAASLFALTVMARWIGRAWSHMKRVRWKFRVPVVGGAALVAAALVLLFRPAKPPRPDIILISLDTLRADRLGCYGCPVGTSPNIDAFSRESAQFMQAISQAPSTAPSHMSLFTGFLPPIHRVTNEMIDPGTRQRLHLGLAASIPTLAQYLKEHGYRTAGFHGGGGVHAILGFDRGFDVYQKTTWEDLYRNSASLIQVGEWLSQGNARKKPFFLFLHNYICHDPYLQAPPSIRKRFLTAPVPGLQEKLENLAPHGLRTDSDFNQVRESWWNLIDGNNAAHRRHIRDLYDAGVNYADFVSSRILDLLKQKGLYDRSLIIVTSDHGEQFWEHGGNGHGGWLFIETLHVPLLIKFPSGMYGGRKIDRPVRLFDLMPTILAYLKISSRLKSQASSLFPLIRNKRSDHPPVISYHEELQTLRIGLGKYAYSNQPFGEQPELLFDRSSDLREKRNLAARRLEVLAQMRTVAAKIMKANQYIKRCIPMGTIVIPTFPDDLKRQLKALGYL